MGMERVPRITHAQRMLVDKDFLEACRLVGMEPNRSHYRKFVAGRGKAYETLMLSRIDRPAGTVSNLN